MGEQLTGTRIYTFRSIPESTISAPVGKGRSRYFRVARPPLLISLRKPDKTYYFSAKNIYTRDGPTDMSLDPIDSDEGQLLAKQFAAKEVGKNRKKSRRAIRMGKAQALIRKRLNLSHARIRSIHIAAAARRIQRNMRRHNVERI